MSMRHILMSVRCSNLNRVDNSNTHVMATQNQSIIGQTKESF